jgi:tetratricopeptide (TPR) repeat protein
MMRMSVKPKTAFIIVIFTISFMISCAYFPKGQMKLEAAQGGEGTFNRYYHYSLATLYTLNGEIDKAINEYIKILRFDQSSPELRIELASLYVRKGEKRKAIAVLEKSTLYSPEDLDSHLLLGGLYGNLKEFDKAIREYETVIEINPEKHEAYLFLSVFFQEVGEPDKAVTILKKLLTISPDHLMGSYYLAKIYLKMGAEDNAEQWLKNTLALKPDFESAAVDLGHLYETQEHNDKVIETYREFIRLNPKNITMRLRLGQIYFRMEEYHEAERVSRDVLEIDDTQMDARFALGLSLLFIGENLDAAIDEFLVVLKNNPQNLKARFFLASAYEKMKRHGSALQEFEGIPADSDLYVNSRIHMGFILKEDGRIEEAIEMLKNAIDKKGTADELFGFLAALYEENDQLDRAEDILKKGLSVFPESIDLHYKLGVIYSKMRREKESLREMEEVLTIEPENAEALNFIGYSYADKGINLDEAERMIKRAMELKPGNGYIIDSLGWVYYRQNKIEKAIKYLEDAFHITPKDPTIAEHLGEVYEKTGRREEALEMYRRSLELNPENDSLKEKIDELTGGEPQAE